MLQAINKYGLIIGFPIIVIAVVVRGILAHSIVAGLMVFVWVIGGLLLAVTALGLLAAAAGRFSDLREESAGSPALLVKKLLIAWVSGLVLWVPPHSMAAHFLMIWALVIGGVLFFLPAYHGWSHAVQLSAVAALIFATGFINAAFHRH